MTVFFKSLLFLLLVLTASQLSMALEICDDDKLYPESCEAALKYTNKIGLHAIQIDTYGPEPFYVVCQKDHRNKIWTLILKRENGEIDFDRDWNDYKLGFGILNNEFWIGLEKLYALTLGMLHKIRFELVNKQNVIRYAEYDAFAIGNENQAYNIWILGNYTGDVGDSFSIHVGNPFSTHDKDFSKRSCAEQYSGGWWYIHNTVYNCSYGNMNALYSPSDPSQNGLSWYHFTGFEDTLKSVKVSISSLRPPPKEKKPN